VQSATSSKTRSSNACPRRRSALHPGHFRPNAASIVLLGALGGWACPPLAVRTRDRRTVLNAEHGQKIEPRRFSEFRHRRHPIPRVSPSPRLAVAFWPPAPPAATRSPRQPRTPVRMRHANPAGLSPLAGTAGNRIGSVFFAQELRKPKRVVANVENNGESARERLA
jgi:hypothetical protein